MGLDVYLDPEIPITDNNSDLYPDHFFKKDYLRSSYNEGGFNAVVSKLIGMDLYWVFQPPQDGGTWTPTQEQLLDMSARAEMLRDALQKVDRFLLSTTIPTEQGLPVPNQTPTPVEDDETRGILAVRRELERYEARRGQDDNVGRLLSGSYSSREGYFYFDDPLPVIGAIPGLDVFRRPAIHLVYEASDNGAFYRKASEIVVEFVQTLIKHGGRIIWSG